MSFFTFVVKYWFFFLFFGCVYLCLTAKTVSGFLKRVVVETHWYQKIRHHLVKRWEVPQLRRIGIVLLVCLVVFPIVLVLFVFAPILSIYLGHLDVQEEKKRAAERAEAEKARYDRLNAEATRNREENYRRTEARKQWLTANKPKLYYNTVSGITAVLRPADYAEAQRLTARSRRNGFWEKEGLLLPACNTFVFMTRQGRDLIDTNTGSDDIRRYYVIGWIAELDDVVKSGEVELIRADDIFVPWVNESLVNFKRQRDSFCNRSRPENWWFELVEGQAPANLQPVD